MNHFRAALLCCLVLAGTLAAPAARAVEVATDSVGMDWSRVPEYRFVPGDRILLDLGPRLDAALDDRREQTVRPDGRITVYPVGDVVAAGLTPMDLQASIMELLSSDLRAPRVTVELVASTASVVHVLGRVERPGPVPAGPFITVSQAIAAAGGFRDDAARNSVVLIHRNGAHSVSVARVKMDRILKGIEFSDVPLSRFDIVYVPRSSVGNLSLFVQQFFGPVAPAVQTAFVGWELFNLDRVFVTRVIKE